MLNRDGISKKTYGAPTQILANVELQESVGCIVPQSLVASADTNGKKIAKAGTPVFINLMSRQTPVSAPGDVAASATAAVSGTGITAAAVVAATFSTAVSGASGTYVFEYNGTSSKWYLGETEATLNTYGITPTGTPANGDKITVTFTAAATVSANAVLLHDVDVTAGNANGTALIFGFVNVNRLDASVVTAIGAATSFGGVTLLKG